MSPAGKPSTARHASAIHSLLDIYARLESRTSLRGLFVGQKLQGSRFTRRTGLTCIVDRKKAEDALDPHERIPGRISYTEFGVRRTVRTDVLQNYGRMQERALFNPGDQVRGRSSDEQPVNATIGAYAVHTHFGPVLVTAGHFVEQIDRRRRIVVRDRSTNPAQTIGGRILRFVRANGTDYALLQPLLEDSNSAFANVPVTAVYDPVLRGDIGTPLFVLARGTQLSTVCRGLNMIYTDPETGETFYNLIVTDDISVPGDSGAALVDSNYRLWGFVIGNVRFRAGGATVSVTVHMPAVRLLSVEPLSIGGSQ